MTRVWWMTFMRDRHHLLKFNPRPRSNHTFLESLSSRRSFHEGIRLISTLREVIVLSDQQPSPWKLGKHAFLSVSSHLSIHNTDISRTKFVTATPWPIKPFRKWIQSYHAPLVKLHIIGQIKFLICSPFTTSGAGCQAD